MLKLLNLKFESANSGIMALSIIKNRFKSSCCKNFMFIFMDIDMPIMDGIETCSKIM